MNWMSSTKLGRRIMGRLPIFRAMLVLACVCSAGLLLAACGSSSSSSSTESSTTASEGGKEAVADGGEAGGSGGGEVAKAASYLEENTKGSDGPLPTAAPTPKEDLNVWVISCAEAATGCALATAATAEAADALGWQSTTFDGKGDPARWAAGVEQGIVDGADAIVLISIDCAPIKQQLTKAKEAGVIVEGVDSFDCDDPVEGGTAPILSHVMEPGPDGESWAEASEKAGSLMAAWAIKEKDGDVKAITYPNEEVATTIYINNGLESEFGECSTCEIVGQIPFSLTELGAPITQKTEAALLKDADANVLAPPYDPVSVPAAQAVLAAGKSSDVDVLGVLGTPESVELIRNDRGQSMSIGWDDRWLGYAAVDDLVRLTDNQKPVYSGWGPGLVDEENLPPAGKPYLAPVDYVGNYLKIWGVG
jgi:ribose transport system substrate-binding protein